MCLPERKKIFFLRKQTNNQNGFVLVLTMVMLATLSILGVMVLNTTDTELSITSNSRINSNAFIATQLGVEYTKIKVSGGYQDIPEDRDRSPNADLTARTNYDLINDDSDIASLLPYGLELEATELNEIYHYLGPETKRKIASQSADNTTNTYMTTDKGGRQDTPYYRVSLGVKAHGRTSSRVETLIERVGGTSL